MPGPEARARLTEEGSLRLFGHGLYGPAAVGMPWPDIGGLYVRVRLRPDGWAYEVRREWDGGLLGRLVSPDCFEVCETW